MRLMLRQVAASWTQSEILIKHKPWCRYFVLTLTTEPLHGHTKNPSHFILVRQPKTFEVSITTVHGVPRE